jgi:hypothetical protein
MFEVRGAKDRGRDAHSTQVAMPPSAEGWLAKTGEGKRDPHPCGFPFAMLWAKGSPGQSVVLGGKGTRTPQDDMGFDVRGSMFEVQGTRDGDDRERT